METANLVSRMQLNTPNSCDLSLELEVLSVNMANSFTELHMHKHSHRKHRSEYNPHEDGVTLIELATFGRFYKEKM